MAAGGGTSVAYSLLLCLLLCVPTIYAQYDDRNFFVNPPVYGARDLEQDQVWKVGETQKIKWRTFYTEYVIRMWQEDLVGTNITDDQGVGTPVYSTKDAKEEYGEFQWLVRAYDYDLNKSNVFSFGLRPSGGQNGFLSFNFNISTDPISSAASSSVSSAANNGVVPTTIPSENPTRPGAAAASNSTSPPGATIVASEGGMPQGTKIGIGVGVGLGLAVIGLLGAIAALMFRKQRYRTKRDSVMMPEQQHFAPGSTDFPPKSPYMEDAANRTYPGEVPVARGSWQEMDGSTPATDQQRQASTVGTGNATGTSAPPLSEMGSADGKEGKRPSQAGVVEMP